MTDTILHARLALAVRDRSLAEKYADELGKLGFEIGKVSARGISFEGTIPLFEETFECEIDMSAIGAQFEDSPTLPDALSEHIDSIYFPTKPTFFSREHKPF